jgi:GntR family transcriptional regulator
MAFRKDGIMTQEVQVESTHIFQRLQIQLARMIADTPPGNRLPAEPELAKQLGVSRATLREAMRSFEGQGLIRRRQGIGTFVVGHAHVIESGLEVLESIETLAKRIQLEVSMGALHVSQVTASPAMAAILQVEEGAQLVQIARVIEAEHRPVAYLVDTLPQDILAAADVEQGFTGSVLDVLLQRGSLPLATSRAEIQAVSATPEIARSLEIQRGDVLLMFSAQLFTSPGRVVDYSLSYFLPGYFQFHVVRRVEATI